MYARIVIPILAVLLLGWLVWQGAHSLWHSGSKRNRAIGSAQAEPYVAPWVRDFRESLDASARDAAAGKLAAAEIDADSAESFVTLAAFDHRPAPANFFGSASAQLDRVLQQKPSERGLFQHVTSARIGLAEFRSSQQTPPPPPPASARLMLNSPRRIAANQVLDPAALDGNYLDATLLPELSEILELPASRAFADKISVENVTIAGAAQTLDGIHWRNVTFIDTHLRYQGGELSLQNVRFLRCRFGLPEDERGARIASAIALAPPPGAISIEIHAAAPASK